MHTVDLNADLGEGFGAWHLGADAALMPLLTSANIACGFHAGDAVTMRDAVAAAATHGVVIGAHPGYPDLQGFGRRDLSATPAEIMAYVIYQIGALDAVCRAGGARLRYVKAHGALYNRAATDRVVADAIAQAIRLADPSLMMLGLANSHLIAAGDAAGLGTAAEAFADRAYTRDGTLVPRSVAGAVIDDAEVVVARALRMVTTGSVVAIDGTDVAIRADSLCVHGDTPGAVALVRALRTHLDHHGVRVSSFVR